MPRKSKAVLARLANFQKSSDTDEPQSKRLKMHNGEEKAKKSGKENKSKGPNSSTDRASLPLKSQIEYGIDRPPLQTRFRLDKQCTPLLSQTLEDLRPSFHEVEFFTGSECDELDDLFEFQEPCDANEPPTLESCDESNSDSDSDTKSEFSDNECSPGTRKPFILDDGGGLSIIFDKDGRPYVKEGSDMWHALRYGGQGGTTCSFESTATQHTFQTSLSQSGTSPLQVPVEPVQAAAVAPAEAPVPPEDRPGKQREAPTVQSALSALSDLEKLLRPPRKTGRGYKDPEISPYVQTRMEGMKALLNFYTNPHSTTFESWGASSFQASIALSHGRHCARRLRKLCREFIDNRTILPINPYGDWNESLLVDEDLSNEIQLYLLEIGKEISAKKLMDFVNRQETRSKHGIEKPISERTARRYLNSLGYRYTTAKKGQYADGHEREDVVYYRDSVFLPMWRGIESRMAKWTNENVEIPTEPMPGLREPEVVVWFHDETIFYAHDRRKRAWYHKDAPAKPYAKGEGASLMVADFVSAKFGWLCSPDGTQSARRVMKPGKNKDGYFTSPDICAQAEEAMAILKEHYPQFEHILIYDNASTHLKRAPDALSARKMPKNVPAAGKNWGVETTERDPATGKIKYNSDGSPSKIKVRMADASFADGSPQSLYFPAGHERAGVFKGMAVILEERGFGNMSKVRAECDKFKCAPGATNCCCRRILYNQPDFANVPSLLETTCKSFGVKVMFLPKFHCELNFIEQCWGYAKRIYRLNPDSSREDALQRNALSALEEIPLSSMRRFANRSLRFTDAYQRGLNGRQAAWAARKYRGHRVLPQSIMDELEKAHVV